MTVAPESTPAPRAATDVDDVVAQLRDELGDTFAEDARHDVAEGKTLLVYSFAAPEGSAADPDGETCRFVRASWVSDGQGGEHALTPELPRPGRPPRRPCFGEAEIEEQDVLGTSEPVVVVRHVHGWAPPAGEPHDSDYFVSGLLVLDPHDGHTILELVTAVYTVGDTFSSGFERRLAMAADGTVTVEGREIDEVGEQACREDGGGDDCVAKFEVEDRYRWNPTSRALEPAD